MSFLLAPRPPIICLPKVLEHQLMDRPDCCDYMPSYLPPACRAAGRHRLEGRFAPRKSFAVLTAMIAGVSLCSGDFIMAKAIDVLLGLAPSYRNILFSGCRHLC